MTTSIENEIYSYTYSLVTQGDTKFYSLTIPSEVLAKTLNRTGFVGDQLS